MIIQEPVQAAIWHCLDHYDYMDAIFLAERLSAEVDSDESTFLLATCYYRAGQTNQAYSLLRKKGCNTPRCKFLLAQCCLEFKNLAEAETILRGCNETPTTMGGGGIPEFTSYLNLDDIILEFGEHSVFALRLLSKIYYQTERDRIANEINRKILKLNPFMWSSYETLCSRFDYTTLTTTPSSATTQSGNNNSNSNIKDTPKEHSKTPPSYIDPDNLFNINNLENFNYCHGFNYNINIYSGESNNCNNNNVNDSSLNNSNGVIQCTPVQLLNNINTNNNSGFGSLGVKQFTPDDTSPLKPLPPRVGKQYRTRSGLTSMLSPLNSSFGILPLDSSNSFNDTSYSSPLIMNSNVPTATLTDSNEQKPLVKRIIKREPNTPLQNTKVSQVLNQSDNNALTTGNTQQTPLPLQGTQNVRRSSRLFTNNNYSVKENNKSPNRNNKFVTPKSPSKKTKSKLSKSSSNKTNYIDANDRIDRTDSDVNTNILNNKDYKEHMFTIQKQVCEGLMNLLKELGRAYYFFSIFECEKSIEILQKLPDHHTNTGWVLTLIAKAYYESTKYKQAIEYFVKVRELEPNRTVGLELYSTALWQQQQEVELSALAQEMKEIDKYCPQTWCVNGNCFSAQKEHDTAIKYFQRATLVDPNFAYAYTLLGHEYVLTEELDKAMNCYRHATRIDPRHYNAWYGIGSIYSKQERFRLAEMHFRKALRINPNSSVLMCHIGVAQNALSKPDAALHTFNLALEKDPKNPLCKFHRASILFGIGRYQEVLQELEELKVIVPKESLVYYLAGKVHKKIGNTHLALMHFSWATDLDPKGANSQIKEAIDPAMNRSTASSDLHIEEEIRGESEQFSSPLSTTTRSTTFVPPNPNNVPEDILQDILQEDEEEDDEEEEEESEQAVNNNDNDEDEEEFHIADDVEPASGGEITLGDSDDTL